MSQSTHRIIQHKIGLLYLAEELACIIHEAYAVDAIELHPDEFHDELTIRQSAEVAYRHFYQFPDQIVATLSRFSRTQA